MNKTISLILFVIYTLLLPLALRAQEWPENLPEDAEIALYSPLSGQSVPLEVAPELRAELITKLNLLGKLENRRMRRHTEGGQRVPTRLAIAHSYELLYRAPGQRGGHKRFLMRGGTRVGGYTENEFDTTRYFTNLSAALEMLAIAGADEPELVPAYAEDSWPDAGDMDESWQLPTDLSPEDDPRFYMEAEHEGKRITVEMEPLPELRAEFIAKLAKLAYLEQHDKRKNIVLPCERQVNTLHVRTTKLDYRKGFYLRGDTWVGGATKNEFNAARYFSPETWQRVHAAYDALNEDTDITRYLYENKTEDTWLPLPEEEVPQETAPVEAEEPRPAPPCFRSKIGKGSVAVECRPGAEELFAAKLLQLSRPEREAYEYNAREFHMPICQTYALGLETSGKPELFVWGTHIGGAYSGHWFDAAELLTPDTWEQLRSRLAGEYDEVGYSTPFNPALPAPQLPAPPPHSADAFPQHLTPEEPALFYMHSRERGDVAVEVVPELRAEFIRKLNREGKLENRFWSRYRESHTHICWAPCHGYTLRCRTADTDYAYGFRFFIRSQTGRVDAARYFTRRSWEEAQAKLRTAGDEAIDTGYELTDAPSEQSEPSDEPAYLPTSFTDYGVGVLPTRDTWAERAREARSVSLVQCHLIYYTYRADEHPDHEDKSPEDEADKSRMTHHPFSAEDSAYILRHLLAAKPIPDHSGIPYLMAQRRAQFQPGRNVEDKLLINFLDEDGDSIVARDWALFHPQSEQERVSGGFALPDAVYAEIERRIRAALEQSAAQSSKPT